MAWFLVESSRSLSTLSTRSGSAVLDGSAELRRAHDHRGRGRPNRPGWAGAQTDRTTARLVGQAITPLLEEGPSLGRSLVDRLKGSNLHNLKELRPG
jgi:hypothetical protein